MMSPTTPSTGGPSTPRGTAAGKHARTASTTANPSIAAPTATPVGGRAFASPAMIRILLTPATADVTPDEFERMTSAIRRIESIRLSDLPRSSQRGETVPPTSALARTGEVHVSFVTSYDPNHAFLSPFNVHRQVLGVLGLAMCSSAQSVEALERAPSALRQLHPNAVVHRVFGFDVGATRPQTMDLTGTMMRGLADSPSADVSFSTEQGIDVDVEGGDMGQGTLTRKEAPQPASSSSSTAAQSSAKPEQSSDRPASAKAASAFAGRQETGLVIFPAVRRDLKDVRFYLRTLVPNLIGDVLDGLDVFVKDLQGKALETPRETLEGAMTSNLSVASSTKTLGAAASSAASRASALFSSFSSADETSRKVSRTSKVVQSVASTGPMGSGRYAKVKADYYLLVGDLWNALHTYEQCMMLLGKERALAGGQDAVWYASALEGWAVARVLTARMGGQVEERAPSLSLPTGIAKEKEKDKNTTEFQFAGKPWSDVAEAYSLALTIYSKCLAPASFLLDQTRSVHPDSPRDYTHPLIHASACIAYSRFLLAVWASGGWNGETFDQLLLGGVPPALAETSRPTMAVYTQHSTASGIERSDIAAPASQSMTNSSTTALKMLDQIHLYASLSAIFGCLGFARKEAYAIQRLQSLVIILIAHGTQLQKQLGSTTSQAVRAGDANHGTILKQLVSIGAGHGSDSVLVLALQVCQTYGINVQLMPLFDMSREHILLRASVETKGGKRLSSPMLQRSRASTYDPNTSSPMQSAQWQHFFSEEAQARVKAISDILHDEEPFGWTEQQILILKDTISICEMLQDKTALLFFALIALRDFWTHLGFEDQLKLKDGIGKVMAEVEGEKESMLQYWGPRDILAGIELEPTSESRNPAKVFFKDVRPLHTDDPDWARRQNTANSAKGNADDVVVQDEAASFAVSLFNPLLIPLELESIRLELSTVGSLGPTFESVKSKGVVLPPRSVHIVRLSGIPRGEGRLCVRGVYIKLPFCAERLFTYEYARGEPAEKTLWKAQSELDDRWTRTKRFGLDARGSGSTGQGLPYALAVPPKARARTQESLWLISVIAKVPEVDIRPSSILRSGSVVLLDGEERLMTLTMTNRSADMPVDYIRFTLADDLQRDIVDLLAEGNVESSDVFELEQDLLKRPFLSSTRDADEHEPLIEVGETKTFTFRLRGKLDVQLAAIEIQFGNKAKSRELGREYFWTRQMSFTFDVRVLPTIFIDGLEFTPVKQSARLLSDNDAGKIKYGALLVSLAVHNAHPSAIEVLLAASDAIAVDAEDQVGAEGELLVRRRLAAHDSVRLHFLLPRLAPIDMESALHRPIPKLVERQFIVSRVQRSDEEEKQLRAKFWLRQSLLQRFRLAQWTDVKTKRTGAIGLAGLHLDAPGMVTMVYGERVEVDVKLSGAKGDAGQRADELSVRAYDLAKLQIDVTNIGDVALRTHYRLESDADERPRSVEQQPQQQQQQFICTSGHLHGQLRSASNDESDSSPSSASSLEPGASAQSFVGLCFLSRGTFTLRLCVYAEGLPPYMGIHEEKNPRRRVSAPTKGGVAQNTVLAQKGITLHVY